MPPPWGFFVGRYMNITFLEDVLPPEGRYALFLRKTKRHLWFNSVAELNAEVESRTASGERDVYFATASYNDDGGGRTQTSVRQLKALRLDIDAGEAKFAAHPDGAYATRDEALTELVQFSVKTKLIPSYIISSGEGLHVYYALKEAVGPNIWNVLASRLEELTRREGLKVDTTTTTDSARILRPLGSLHSSGASVYVIKATGKHYTPDSVTDLTPEPTRPVKSDSKAAAINDEASHFVGPPKDMLKIISRCAAVNAIAVVRGNVQEPAWRAMLGIAKHCFNGQKLAHMLSSGHPDYSYDETEDKMAAWQAGPATCSQFDKTMGKCGECQYNGKIKSPIILGEMTADEVREKMPELDEDPAPETDAEPSKTDGILDGLKKIMPEHFKIKRKDGKHTLIADIKVQKENEAGDLVELMVDVPITTDLFWVSNWSESSSSEDNSGATLCTFINGRIREYEMDMSIVADHKRLATFLAGRSVLLTPGTKASTLAAQYVWAHINRIKETNMREKITERFGLRYSSDGSFSCAHGRFIINRDGTVTTAALVSKLRSTGNTSYVVRSLPPKPEGAWTAQDVLDYVVPSAKWHAEFLKRHYGDPRFAKFQLAIMMGLASPMMAFVDDEYLGGDLPAIGLTVSLYSSGSGMGKTAAASMALAAYGDPVQLRRGGSDATSTLNARIQMMEAAGTMPVLLDEAGETTPKAAADLIKSVANGKPKIRLDGKGAPINGIPWALVNLMTTNRPQRELVALDAEQTDAVQNRMLELDVDDTPRIDRKAVMLFDREKADLIRNHAGSLGFLIHYAMVVAGPAWLVEAREKIKANSSVMAAEQSSSRFQWRGMLAVEVVVQLLKGYGIELFDMDLVRSTFDEAYEAAKEYTNKAAEQNEPAEMLARFLNDIRGETAVTNGWTSRNTGHMDVLLNRPGLKISARYAKSLNQTFVSKRRFDEWAAERRISARSSFAKIKQAGVLVQMHRSDIKDCFVTRRDPLSGMQEATGALVSGFTVDMDLLSRALDTDANAMYEAPQVYDGPGTQVTLQ